MRHFQFLFKHRATLETQTEKVQKKMTGNFLQHHNKTDLSI